MSKIIKFESIVNPAIIFFILGGILLFFGPEGWWPDFYHPFFYSLGFFASAFFIILPKFLLKPKNQCQRESVSLFRSAIAIAFLANSAGELYLYQLYKYGFPYDKLLHLFDGLLFVIVLTSFIETWNKIPLKKAIGISVILVIIGGFLWEFYEYSSDLILKTRVFGVYGNNVISDTIYDIILDITGVTAAYLLLTNPKFSDKIINKYCHWPIVTGGGK